MQWFNRVAVGWSSARQPLSGGCVQDWNPKNGKVTIPAGGVSVIAITIDHPDKCPGDGALIDFAAWEQGKYQGNRDQKTFVVLCSQQKIPTVSEWGMVAMVLLLLAGGRIYFGRRRAATRAA